MISKGIHFFGLFFLGAVVGLAYMGFLWWSIKRFVHQKKIVLTLVGFFSRLAAIALVLAFIAKQFQIEGVLLFFLGFFVTKKWVERKTKKRQTDGYHS